jgi:hypothetical protein
VSAHAAAWDALANLVNEAIVMQDSAERLLGEIREEGPLGELARRGGPLVTRFEAMRRELPPATDPELHGRVERLDSILAHHAMMLSTSLDLLAVNWRSERMREELRKIEGLGRPASWLEALKGELDGR